MRTVIVCANCTRVMGTVGAPSKDDLRAATKGSSYAGMVGLIPADFMTEFSKFLNYVCDSCTRGANNGSEKGSEESSEEIRKQADPHQLPLSVAESRNGRG